MTKNILIVDDEAHMRDLVARALDPLLDSEVEFHIASNGDEALQIASEIHPDIAILDIMMPGISGIDVCQKLKNYSVPPYVLMLTAMGQTTDKLDALEVGADEYITKPFDPDRLLQRVANILKVEYEW